MGALRSALRLLGYLPDNNHSNPPVISTSLTLDDYVEEEAKLLHKTFTNPVSGFNTPFDMSLLSTHPHPTADLKAEKVRGEERTIRKREPTKASK